MAARTTSCSTRGYFTGASHIARDLHGRRIDGEMETFSSAICTF
jgi:hypothetical protein